MRTTKRRYYLWITIGLMGLFLFGMFIALRPSPSLMDRAQAVAQTDHWEPDPENPFGVPMYYWSGDNDLTYFGKGHDGTLHLIRRTTNAKGNASVSEGPALTQKGDYTGQLSPNGKWFVEWSLNKTWQHIPTFIAMDGTQRHAGQPTNGTAGVWTPGSDAMLCEVWHAGKWIEAIDRYHPDSGQREKIVPTGLPPLYTFPGIDSHGRLVGFEQGSGINHSASSAPSASQNYPFLKMARVDPASSDALPEQWKIAVPEYVDHGGCRLSPSGDRLLWTLHGDTTPSVLRFLRNHIPGLSAYSTTGYRWLVSGLHGEEMHEIACYRDPPANAKAARTIPYARPCWMPDSRHISFIYQDTLYIRPVD